MHNIPIAIALMTMLLQSNITKSKAIGLLVIFALITPLGAFTSYAIGENMIGNFSIYFDRIMAVVVGIFLHISTTILFESSENHRFNFLKFVIIIIGASVAILC
jgi:zinc transporter ZupT